LTGGGGENLKPLWQRSGRKRIRRKKGRKSPPPLSNACKSVNYAEGRESRSEKKNNKRKIEKKKKNKRNWKTKKFDMKLETKNHQYPCDREKKKKNSRIT